MRCRKQPCFTPALRRDPVTLLQRDPRSSSRDRRIGRSEGERSFQRRTSLREPARTGECLREAYPGGNPTDLNGKHRAEMQVGCDKVTSNKGSAPCAKQCRQRPGCFGECGVICSARGRLISRHAFDRAQLEQKIGGRHSLGLRRDQCAADDSARAEPVGSRAHLTCDAQQSTWVLGNCGQDVVVYCASERVFTTTLCAERARERVPERNQHRSSPGHRTLRGNVRPPSLWESGNESRITLPAAARADRGRTRPAPARSTRTDAGGLADRRCTCPPSGPSCSCRVPHRAPSGK